ncbi:MAG: amidohydrolase family protein [Myxococcota bacterium]
MSVALAVAIGLAASSADILLRNCDVRTVCCGDRNGATIWISGERIEQIDPVQTAPEGAEIIDCEGAIVTPGLVEADSALGLTEVSLEPLSNDAMPTIEDPIRARLDARDALDPRSSLVAVARRDGVTSVVTSPMGGVVEGLAAWLDLVGPGSRSIGDAVIGPVALSAHAGQLGSVAYGGSRLSAFAALRIFFEDAAAYRRNEGGFLRRAFYQTMAARGDLAAAQPVLRGEMPLMVEAHRAADIERVLRWSEQQRVKVIIVGASEGHLLPERLAAAEVPVVVSPFQNLPSQFEARQTRTDNAAVMEAAGVQVILATRDSHRAGNLRFAAGNAVRAGFPAERALAAITSRPASAFGQNVGIIRKGNRADLVLWSGDPFEPRSHAELVIIRGEIQPTESRQTRLARRYIDRLITR